MTEERRNRINNYDHAVLYLTLRRRGERGGARDGPVHGTGHILFHQDGRFSCFREIGQGTHRPTHLTEGENHHHRNEL